MPVNEMRNLRNYIVCGHGGVGKTSLADAFLTITQTVPGKHCVDDGTSVCDFDPEEKKHKYTIEAAAINFDHGGFHFNVIDTPGYPDFIGQVIGPMEAADNALVVINAQSGIEVNTRRVFDTASDLGLGRVIAINKMDEDNIDFQSLIDEIRELWGAECLLLNVPVGLGADFRGVINVLDVPEDTTGAIVDPAIINQPMIEMIIESDDEVMEQYFEGNPPSDETLKRLMVKAIAAGTLVPIVCVSSKTGVGMKELMDTMGQCGLSPLDISRFADEADDCIPITPAADGPLVAKVFRTRIDPWVQKLNFIRIYSGTLKRDDTIHFHLGNDKSTEAKSVKVGQLFRVLGETTTAVDSAGPGDIVAVAKVDELHSGTVLGDVHLPLAHFPSPMVSMAVLPKSRGDEAKLSGALHKVVEEDSTFSLTRDEQTKELVMTGMSELHLSSIRERLSRRDKLEVETKMPRIPFHETISQPAEGSCRHKKQSGGRGQFGEIHIRMMPLPNGTDIEQFATKSNFASMKSYHYDEKSNFLWVDSVVGGVIPINFMPAVGKGFAEQVAAGVIAGYPVQDVCVEVHFGKHHPVDSSEAAFKIAARNAFRQVFKEAGPNLLEPIVAMAITVPESSVGDIYSDLSSRGGRVLGNESRGGRLTVVNCEAPLREVANYSRTLSSITGGMGSFEMHVSHYEPMPMRQQMELAEAK